MQKRIGGIIFPVRPLLQKLKKYTKMRIAFHSCIYLAAVIEYLVKEVFDISLNGLANQFSPDSDVIRSKHLRLVMKGDRELNMLTNCATVPISSPKKKSILYQ